MWTSSRFVGSLCLVVSVACSGKTEVTRGNANGGTSSGGTSGATGATGSGFCVLGAQSCPCDATGSCLHGLSCNGDICCDSSTGSCSAPGGQGTPTSGTGAATGTANGSGGSNGTGAATGTSTGPGSGATGPGNPKDNGGTSSAPASVCTPGVVGPVITDCGYPYASSNALTNVLFNESEVLRVIAPSGGSPLASVRLFYNDEHALTLGVRSVVVKSASGTTTHDFPVSELSANPGAVRSPQTGTNDLTGNEAGVDPEGRPMWPALFVTDTTTDANNRSGDWQMSGTAWNPSAVFGTWKGAVRSVDTTVTPNVTTITPDGDPAKNDWNLGGGDPVPASLTDSSMMGNGMGMGMGMPGGMTDQGYGAEARWDVVLVAGHSYRIQVMVHDGDQNQVGGDTGEACVNFCADSACPDYSVACSADSPCPIETESICVSGCCI